MCGTLRKWDDNSEWQGASCDTEDAAHLEQDDADHQDQEEAENITDPELERLEGENIYM